MYSFKVKTIVVSIAALMAITACGGPPPAAADPSAAAPPPALAAPPAPDLAAIFTSTGKPVDSFKLTSASFADGATLAAAHVFNSFGCSGGNQSPALSWSGAPEGTKSYAILMYDPDAPTGSGFWHWVVYNLPAATTDLAAGAGEASGKSLPPGSAQGRTDYGSPGYGGPCPPPGSGNHRYYFRVHALKVEKLELPAGATAAFVGFNINANTLATAQIVGVFGR
jgi:Raf kinase inhibitor-like YbhB/YbcL family protein